MRMLIKLEAEGSTLADVVKALELEWSSFCGNAEGIPYDTEVSIEKRRESDTYVATCLVRAKRER